MSNIEALSSLYSGDRSVAELNTWASGEKQEKIQINGLIGASDSFLLSGCFLHNRYSQIYIAADKEDAAYVLNTLQAILENKTSHFFPESFKISIKYDYI